MLCHFLQVCVWSETVFPLLSPSARPSGLPPLLDSVMLICHHVLTGTVSTVSKQGSSAGVFSALCWPSLVPWPDRYPCPGGGGDVLSWYVCSTQGSCDSGYRTPQNWKFQPCVELQSLICRLMESLLLLPSPSLPSVALTKGSCISSEGFPCWPWACQACGDRAAVRSCAGIPPGLWCSITQSISTGEALVLYRKMLLVSDGKEMAEMAVIIALWDLVQAFPNLSLYHN